MLAAGCSLLGRLHTDREVVIVAGRAVVQVVAALIRVVFATPALAPAYLVAMLAVAASRRLVDYANVMFAARICRPSWRSEPRRRRLC
jgi:hypothetical protein